jgi:hypothetical protein
MHRVLSHRPSPAMLVALLALFVSLGGSAYAALTLPNNSVGTMQLMHGAVTGAKLHAGAVTAQSVKRHSLQAADFAAGQLPTGAGSTATCAPDLSNAPPVPTGDHAGLNLGGTSYPLSQFEIGGVGCPMPPKLITVIGNSQTLAPLLNSGSVTGDVTLYDQELQPIESYRFTNGRVTSFTDDSGAQVQIEITAAARIKVVVG